MKFILALIASTQGISMEQCKVCIDCFGGGGGHTDEVPEIVDPTLDPALSFVVNAGNSEFLTTEL